MTAIRTAGEQGSRALQSGRGAPRARKCERAADTVRPWRLARVVVGLLSLALSQSAVASIGGLPPEAKGESGFDGDEARVTAQLMIDALGATAERVRAGVLFDLDPGWHLYWRNPGDTGLPTRFDWRIDGGRVGATRWPAPSVYQEADGLFTTFGYEGRVLIPSELVFDTDMHSEQKIAVDVDLLVCRTECIPAEFSLERSLTAALIDSPDNEATHALFETFEARVPRDAETLGVELESLFSQSAIRPGDAFSAALLVRSCADEAAHAGDCELLQPTGEGVLFIPEADQPITLEHTGLRRIPGQKNASFVTFRGQANDDAQAGDARLRGVLALTSRAGEIRHVRVDLPLPLADSGANVVMLGKHWLETSPSTHAAAVTTRTLPFDPGIGILEAILLALVGGLILNLMPCVLPILAIKVFSVAEMAGRSRRDVLESGAAYAAGILSSMAVLAGVVLALRAVGTQVGWGFQFQSPIFVATIATVLVAFAMNLFGTFEISLNVGAAASVGAEATGARRSFFEGLLAVVLATPCSAPFLGTAVGFAFAGSSFTIVAIFLAIGAGLAAPFLLICLVPAWSRFMPRSGPWMAKLRAGLGFALLATVVWLIWIAGGQSGIEGMTSLLGLLLIVAFGLWIYGALQASGHDWLRVGVGIAVILVAFAGLNLIRMNPGDTGSGSAQELAATADSDWLPWEPAAIRNALDQGHPVLVAFSAEWCITCKVNERVVLQSPRVTSELERLNVSVFKADWTRRDESIRAELSRFGRAGVPMYLVYDPDAPDRPQLLPELLSIGDVVESLRQASRVAERSTPTS